MSRKKLDDDISTRVQPYAVFSSQNKRGIVLNLSKSLVDLAGLKHRDRVDLFFERHSKTWRGPIIIIKKGGTQRSVYRHSQSDSSWWGISVTQFVRQFDIATPSHRLKVLDYIDGELVIDLSLKTDEELDRGSMWKSRSGKRERVVLTILGDKEIQATTNTELLEVIESLADKEGKSRTNFIWDAVRYYIEDKYHL